MAKDMAMEVTGLDEVIKQLDNFTNNSILKPMVYKGAGVVADEMKKQVNSLKTGRTKTKHYISENDKRVLSEAMGIAPIKSDDKIHTKVGFDGYYINSRGQERPVPLLANSVNAGTSFMTAQNFVDKTARVTQSKVYEAMSKEADNIFK